MAIGEIYRAVVILGVAVKFYKPWILLSDADLEGIYSLLEECHSLWSTSGLEETIPAELLLDSIRHIRNLDELAIINEVLTQEESQCGLSLLSPAVVPAAPVKKQKNFMMAEDPQAGTSSYHMNMLYSTMTRNALQLTSTC